MRTLAPLALLLALSSGSLAQDAPAQDAPAQDAQDAPGAPAQSAPAQRYRIESRLRLLQGEAGELGEGVSEGLVTRAALQLSGQSGEELRGRLQLEGRQQGPLPFRGRLDDLLWLGAPRLLGPLARDLREARAGSRRVRLLVAGQPLVLTLRLRPRLSKEGREVLVTGGGERSVGHGVTLRAQVRLRLRYLAGERRLDLRLRWTAAGGPGADAESRVHLETRVREQEGA